MVKKNVQSLFGIIAIAAIFAFLVSCSISILNDIDRPVPDSWSGHYTAERLYADEWVSSNITSWYSFDVDQGTMYRIRVGDGNNTPMRIMAYYSSGIQVWASFQMEVVYLLIDDKYYMLFFGADFFTAYRDDTIYICVEPFNGDTFEITYTKVTPYDSYSGGTYSIAYNTNGTRPIGP